MEQIYNIYIGDTYYTTCIDKIGVEVTFRSVYTQFQPITSVRTIDVPNGTIDDMRIQRYNQAVAR